MGDRLRKEHPDINIIIDVTCTEKCDLKEYWKLQAFKSSIIVTILPLKVDPIAPTGSLISHL